MKSKVYDIIIDALEKAKVKFDTDGENIWVDPPQGEEGRTVSVNVMECEDAADEPPQQQDKLTDGELEKGAKVEADGNHRFTVSINASLGTIVEVVAPDESTAEGIVNAKWMSDEIKIESLSLHDTRIDCTGLLD